jgi:hypothetical protein
MVHNHLSVQICLYEASPAGAHRLELKNHTVSHVFYRSMRIGFVSPVYRLATNTLSPLGPRLCTRGPMGMTTFLRLGFGLIFHGEFDPGSGRTLAACLTHASGATNLLGAKPRTGE